MQVIYKVVFTVLLLHLYPSALYAQPAAVAWPSPEVEQMYRQAREFHSKGHLQQAITMYKQAIQAAPGIMLLHRELGQALHISGSYTEASEVLAAVIDNGAADEETYHIMISSLMSKGDRKKAQSIIQSALERYPHSGLLYHIEGQVYESAGKNEDALQSWVTGIEQDPAYHMNYYDATRAYMNTNKIAWALLYGEMFVNIEQQTPRSHDVRKMLLECYRRLFQSIGKTDAPKFGAPAAAKPRSFEEAVNATYVKLSPVVADGLTAENLIMLRTRFIMDWYTMGYHKKYPFSLFTRHDDMLRNGYFDIYNQWLFGKAENANVYAAWVKFHNEAIPELEEYLKEKTYRPSASDFYNDKTSGDKSRRKKKG